jgi:tripartite-type tricarboxylate transporter receptor subunit TctC
MLARRRFLRLAGLAAASSAISRRASADTYPSRPLRWIVPFPAGGSTDLIARLMGEWLAARLGQPVVIENKPGGGTNIAVQAVVNAPADGYTIGIAVSSHVINPSLHKTMPYDTLRDLAPVSLLSFQSIVMTATPALEASDVPSLVALAKRTPGGLAYASPGIGTMTHLAGELFARAAGIPLTHVPYNGGAPATTDVMAGRVPTMFDIWYGARPTVAAGKLKVIGVLDPKRMAERPDIMTFAEVYPGLEVKSSLGLVMRGTTPRPLI